MFKSASMVAIVMAVTQGSEACTSEATSKLYSADLYRLTTGRTFSFEIPPLFVGLHKMKTDIVIFFKIVNSTGCKSGINQPLYTPGP